MHCFGQILHRKAVSVQLLALTTFILDSLLGFTSAEQVLHTFTGQVGRYNYTYYKLAREGSLALVLEPLQGDADIYISDKTLLPTFENFELHSTTCGEDRIDIPSGFPRPIGVGIYGHPSYEQSVYRLSVVVGNDNMWEKMTLLGDEQDRTKQKNVNNQRSLPHPYQSAKDSPGVADNEEESLLWTIFISILKIVFDVLM